MYYKHRMNEMWVVVKVRFAAQARGVKLRSPPIARYKPQQVQHFTFESSQSFWELTAVGHAWHSRVTIYTCIRRRHNFDTEVEILSSESLLSAKTFRWHA